MKEEARLMIGLTKAQCRNVAEFIEFYLIECIRDDTSIDNIEWIERIVPQYPVSSDVERYHRLIEVLSLYRLTMGQPRQEELLELLKDMHLSQEQLKSLAIDLCPFNKNNSQYNGLK